MRRGKEVEQKKFVKLKIEMLLFETLERLLLVFNKTLIYPLVNLLPILIPIRFKYFCYFTRAGDETIETETVRQSQKVSSLWLVRSSAIPITYIVLLRREIQIFAQLWDERAQQSASQPASQPSSKPVFSNNSRSKVEWIPYRKCTHKKPLCLPNPIHFFGLFVFSEGVKIDEFCSVFQPSIQFVKVTE